VGAARSPLEHQDARLGRGAFQVAMEEEGRREPRPREDEVVRIHSHSDDSSGRRSSMGDEPLPWSRRHRLASLLPQGHERIDAGRPTGGEVEQRGASRALSQDANARPPWTRPRRPGLCSSGWRSPC
jgi:hypothetical protein